MSHTEMGAPTMQFHRPIRDVTVMNDFAEVPTLGVLPVNAFVLHTEQPLVVDTGLGNADKTYLYDHATAIDPADVRWIYLTHPARRNTGCRHHLLDAAPQTKFLTTFLSVGILST